MATAQLRSKRKRARDDSGAPAFEQQLDCPDRDPRVPSVFVGDERCVEALKRCPVFSSAYMRLLQQPDCDGVYMPVRDRDMLFKLNGALLMVQHQGAWRLCVPECPVVRQSVLYQFHDHPTAGHIGASKTYEASSRVNYWPGIRRTVQDYVESCVCGSNLCRSLLEVCNETTWFISHLGGSPAPDGSKCHVKRLG